MAGAGRLATARRAVKLVAVLVIVAVLVGATYQGVATAFERRALPHPGRLVDAGGHQLHAYCTGKGSPTVVLEAPAGAMSAAWGALQPRLARLTRTCSYDRSGLGWSESGDRGYDPRRVPDELRALLTGAGEPGPFIMVGHGFGASLVRLFAARFDADTLALVLIDEPGHEGATAPNARQAAVRPWLARAGILRARRALAGRGTDEDDAAARAIRAFSYRPDHLTRSALEAKGWEDTVRLAAASAVPAHVAIVNVTDGAPQAGLLPGDARAEPVLAAVAERIRRSRQR
jgi:pimeloyl-ACP methyl ester carboxylesterase